MAIATNLATRESFVEAIKQAGLYIADHAENLLGEYPALLSEMDITAHFRFDEPVTIEVRRLHIACDKEDYPKNWREIALGVKEAASWKCEECGKQCRKPGEPFDTHRRTLTVYHKDHVPENCDPSNLIALCIPCNLRADAKHHVETRRSRRSAETGKSGIDTHKDTETGHSGHENHECGEI